MPFGTGTFIIELSVCHTANETFANQAQGTDYLHSLYATDSSGSSLTVEETAGDSATPSLRGSEATSDNVLNPLGVVPGVNPDPAHPAAANSLLAQFGAENTTTSGTFNDTLATNESATLNRQFSSPDGDPLACTGLSFNMTANDNFSLQDGGQDGVAVSGSMAPDNIRGNFNAFDNGSGSTRYVVAGTSAADLTLTVNGGESDTDNQSENGSDQFHVTVDVNNPLTGSPASTGGSGSPTADPIDEETGNDSFNAGLNLREGFTVTDAAYSVSGGAWTLQSLGNAGLTAHAATNESDFGNSADRQTGNGGPANGADNYRTSDGGTEDLTFAVTPAAGGLTVTEDDSGQDNFTESDQGNDGYQGFANSNDPLAATLNGSTTSPGTTQATGSDRFQLTLGGGDTFEMDATVFVPMTGTPTVQDLSADVTTQDTTSETDAGSGADNGSGSGSSAANVVSENYQDNVSASDRSHLQLGGTPDNLSATLDDSATDSYTDSTTGSDNVNTNPGTATAVQDVDALQVNDRGSDSATERQMGKWGRF